VWAEVFPRRVHREGGERTVDSGDVASSLPLLPVFAMVNGGGRWSVGRRKVWTSRRGKMKFIFFRDWSLNFRRGDWSVNEFLHPGLGEKGFNGFRKFVAAFFTPQ
jgi:hypothetical protein